ncbi:unnamed protein product [Peronospora destructor]|uniref:Uncharacterized protein n=1 Tax=Peronospora destructor TaxID=86335 RepID=A0AAV0U0P2_9STRA|nr:unnamed protein product [Peronospora destructor]
MGQSPKSPPNDDAILSSSPLHWDGKCQKCRKLMSRCICFRESDTDPLDTGSSSEVIADASQTRPLWNALRKMHRTSMVTHQSLPNSSQPSGRMSNEHHCNRSEALTSLKATTSVTLTSNPRHHVDRRSDTQSFQSSRHKRRKPRDGPSLDHPLCGKDGLQRAGITSSSHILMRDVNDVGVMRSVQSTYNIDKHNLISASRPKEIFSCGSEDGLRPSDENDGTVWEL